MSAGVVVRIQKLKKRKKSFSPKVIIRVFIEKVPVSKYEPVCKTHTEFEGKTWDNVGIKAK